MPRRSGRSRWAIPRDCLSVKLGRPQKLRWYTTPTLPSFGRASPGDRRTAHAHNFTEGNEEMSLHAWAGRIYTMRGSRVIIFAWLLYTLPSSAQTIVVTSYGPTGNGTTDDTAATNNAIAALTGGATLLFPCGTYLVTSMLTLGISNVTVDGSNCATIHNTGSGAVMAISGSGNGNPNYGPAMALSAV